MSLLNYLNQFLYIDYNDFIPYSTASLFKKSGTYCIETKFTLEKAKFVKHLLNAKGYKAAIIKDKENYLINCSRNRKHLNTSIEHTLFYSKDAEILEIG